MRQTRGPSPEEEAIEALNRGASKDLEEGASDAREPTTCAKRTADCSHASGLPLARSGGDGRSANRSIRGLPIVAQCPHARRCRLARRTAWASGQTLSPSERVLGDHVS